jgi:hypothetical protein
MRLLFREGLAKDGQTVGALVEQLESDDEGPIVEWVDGGRVGLSPRPVDAVTLLRLHRGHYPSIVPAMMSRHNRPTALVEPATVRAWNGH